MGVESYSSILSDVQHLLALTEAKIAAVSSRRPQELMGLLQEELDPLARLNSRSVLLSQLTEAQKAELRHYLMRWADRERYLADLLEQHLGYIDFMKQLLGIQDRLGLDIGI
ncbi:hypothetical protein TPY_2366 [Sulfobacillus acidophilus TPY]|uniref:Flagellar protein FlgN n=1 Tax=Sulfobacillus acidophilus (strain ATCC 700253 / DSM 10332 / NAL) TaxID=679936 RepID=G8U123_SULAD|nr:hypothetical protein TPY_2366 [Sulfobacillus acidophilus TPY]AEW06568.1 hypothetical protein Sulac_3122 [Sulfobacillus acidophilus DSM 10332]